MRGNCVAAAASSGRSTAAARVVDSNFWYLRLARNDSSPGPALSSGATCRMRTAASPSTVPPKRPASSARLKDMRASPFIRAWSLCYTLERGLANASSPLLVCERLDHSVGNVDSRADVDRFLQNEIELFALRDLLDDLVGALQHSGQFFVFAQVQIFPEFALHALQVAVHAREILLLVPPLRFAHGHAIFFQAALQVARLLGKLLQLLVAGRKFFFDFFLCLYRRRRIFEKSFEFDESDLEVRGEDEVCTRHQRRGGKHKRDFIQLRFSYPLIRSTKIRCPG